MRNLAPHIHRQRLVIEGMPAEKITADDITSYLSALSVELEMIEILAPVMHQSELYGWAGWIHWENSGAHFYAWEEPMLFFSVDIYTCKRFDAAAVTEFTRDYLDAVEVVAKEF